MGLFKPSVKSLLGRGDIRGLVGRLEGKDMAEAWIALKVLGERAVPGLIEALGGPMGGPASAVLAEIGTPALPALVETIRSGPEDRVMAAGVAIHEMKNKGARLPDGLTTMLAAVKDGDQVETSRRVAAMAALGGMQVQAGA
jgi:hypothetical protein